MRLAWFVQPAFANVRVGGHGAEPRPGGSGVAPRCGAAVTSNAAVTGPAPSRRDAAPTGSLRDFHGQASTSVVLVAGMKIKARLRRGYKCDAAAGCMAVLASSNCSLYCFNSSPINSL